MLSLATIIIQPQSRNSLNRKPIPALKQEKIQTVKKKKLECIILKAKKSTTARDLFANIR